MRPDPAFAEDVVARSIKGGADQAEIFCKSYKNISVEIKDQTVESLSSSFSSGYSVRVIKNNRLGFSFSTDLRESDQVIKRAIDASASVDRDAHLGLAAPSLPRSVDIYDTEVSELRENDIISMAMRIEQSAFEADNRIRRVRKPSASCTVSETIIASSAGVHGRYEATACSAQVTAIAESGRESQTGWDYRGSRFLNDLSPEGVGRTAAMAAIRLLGSRKIRGLKTNILLDAAVAVDFLSVFAASLSSEAVQKGKSLLAGKLNTKVISPAITITDSGLLSGRLGSRPFDDEGVSTETKSLINNGVLHSYLYNTYTARKGNALSTGNAIRGSFSSLPLVGITNLFLEPSSPAACLPKEDLFRHMQNGLYVVDAMGIHTVNPISGDFSIGVTGLWIEHGEIIFPVKEAAISGNLLDFFSKVSVIGDDMRFYGNTGSPSLVIADIDISA